MDNGIKLAGSVNRYGFSQADDIYSVKGISPTILAHLQGQTGHAIQIAYDERVQGQTEIAPKVRDDTNGICPTIRVSGDGGSKEIKVAVYERDDLPE